jgi:GST-like protein
VYALPLSHPDLCNGAVTPNMIRWLRAIHARPSIEKTFSLSRMRFAEREK